MAYHEWENKKKKGGWGRSVTRIVGILILIGAVAAVAIYRNEIMTRMTRVFAATDEEPVPVLSLEKGPLQLEVEANGEIVGLETVPVPTPNTRSGSLKLGWLIPEGSMVGVGTPVVRFDSTDILLNLEQQQNTLTRNQENGKIQTGSQQLTAKTMEIDRTQAKMDYDYSMTVLPEDETIYSKWEIIEAKLNADFAKARIDNLAAKARVQRRVASSQQQVSAIERNRATQEVGIIQQTLSTMELRSPANGLLLYRRDRRRDPQIGDNCQAGQVVVEVVDLNALQARIYVLEKEAGNLQKDKPVLIRLDALPDREFNGIVRSVSSVAASLERNSPLKYFTCDVTIRDAGEYLRFIKPGMALRARVILEKYDSCFVVPASAIDFKGNDTFVYIKKSDTGVARNDFERKQVRIGMGKHGQATILSGVNEKELIALRNPIETRKLSLPDFSKASVNQNQQRGRGGPGGDMMRMMQGGERGGGGGGGGGGYGGGGGGGMGGGRGR
jgi:HlyD family secretion protein